VTAVDQPGEHPEEILHRARAGLPLSARERLIRLEHLRACDVCRLLEETRADLLDEASRPADGKSITELVAAAMASFPAPPPVPRRTRARHPARMADVALVAVFVLAGAALAARWIVEKRASEQARVSGAVAVRAGRAGAEHAPRANGAPTLGAADDGPALPARPATAADNGAAELFARATAARRAGDVNEARRTYDRLWQDFPETLEAQTGRVAYGRWLLDRGEARAARGAFADYLRRAPRGTLAAEARVGLAEALDLLGDRVRARQAWQDVLANPADIAFPGRATTRLRALDARGDRAASTASP